MNLAGPGMIRTPGAAPTARIGSFSPLRPPAPSALVVRVNLGDALGDAAPATLAEAAQHPDGKTLTTAQRDMVNVIEREFYAAGYDTRMAAAAVANAWHESGLNPRAAGDVQGGVPQSIGLFQLYSKGAGAGMSVADRQDPVKNTRRIIETLNAGGASAVRSAWKAGADAAELARLFCIYVERPKDSATKGLQRAATARKMFPSLPSTTPTLAAAGETGYALVWAGVGAGALLMGALYLRSRRST